MSVSDTEKLRIILDELPTIITKLAERSADGEVAADDIVDLLAIGIAAIIDNDPNLEETGRQDAAIEYIGRRIDSHVRTLGEYRLQHHRSLLSSLMQDPPEIEPSA